jgi:hypothetical protein
VNYAQARETISPGSLELLDVNLKAASELIDIIRHNSSELNVRMVLGLVDQVKSTMMITEAILKDMNNTRLRDATIASPVNDG